MLLPGHQPPPMKTKYVLPRRRTSPLIWLVAVLCTIIAIAVIVAGIIVFVGYIVIRPKVPFISVIYTHLDVFDYDQAGLLTTQVTVQTKWENDNARAHASFYGAGFVLSLHGMEIAKLVADPFDVSKNSSVELGYTVASSSIPLTPELMMLVDMSLKRDLVTFELRGNARTRWRVGILGSVKFWLHLNCQLHFTRSTMNGSSTHCSTRSK